jgi:predicted MFS family arabinose efflux permease
LERSRGVRSVRSAHSRECTAHEAFGTEGARRTLKKIDWRLVAIAAGNFAHGSATMGVIGLLNEIADDLAVSIASAGQITTGMQLTAALGAPLVALFGGSLARRTVLVSALGLVAGCQFVAALAPAYVVLLAARTLAGLGTAAYAPTAAAAAAHMVEPERRGAALAAVFIGFSLASIAGVPLGVFLGGVFGWRWAMAGFGVLALLALVLVAASVPAKLERGASLEAGAWKAVFENRALVALIACNLLQATAQMTFYSYIAPLLRAGLNVGPGAMSLLLAWLGFWGLLGAIAAMRLIDRLSPPRVLAVATAGMLVSTFGWSGAAGSIALVLVLLAVFSAASVLMFTSTQAQVLHLDPRVANVALAMLASTNFGGGFLGPAIGGVVIATLGLGIVPWTAGALFAAGGLALVWAMRLARRLPAHA